MSDRAFIAFSLSPVQSFIGAARTVRDLWTGSYLLSWLTFHAMRPILQAHGPDGLVFPDMAHNPFWLRDQGQPVGDHRTLLAPCLPNRFLAEVPAEGAADLAGRCEKQCHTAWADVGEHVRRVLDTKEHAHSTLSPESLWHQQVGSFFEVRTATLSWNDYELNTLQRLLGEHALGSDDDHLWAGRWQVIGKFLQAERAVRHFPIYAPVPEPDGKLAQKCTLLGSYEHVGPADRALARTYWESAADAWDQRGTRTGPRERLCAVSLVKRFAWPLFFVPTYNMRPAELRFADTATVAAACWLQEKEALDPTRVREQHDDWSGQWLHWSRPDQEDESPVREPVWREIQAKRRHQGPPPAYYAILVVDADRMGDKLLKGGKGRHKAISGALANFALDIARPIVEEKHKGELIYAGGDDVLALLPTETALACAEELNSAFAANWRRNFPDESVATVSAGLAIVHYKEDLRFALAQAHAAEKAAKDGGRDALQVIVCRRSGEHASALCPWGFVGQVAAWVQAFLARASDRWAYHLKGELGTLRGLDEAAMRAEIKRQVGRAETRTQQLLGGAEAVSHALATYRTAILSPGREPKHPPRLPDVLTDFITLCQTASFLARGRDA